MTGNFHFQTRKRKNFIQNTARGHGAHLFARIHLHAFTCALSLASPYLRAVSRGAYCYSPLLLLLLLLTANTIATAAYCYSPLLLLLLLLTATAPYYYCYCCLLFSHY